jgi:hypothetical protein
MKPYDANKAVDALVDRWRRETGRRGALQSERLAPWWVVDILGGLFLLGVLVGWAVGLLAM